MHGAIPPLPNTSILRNNSTETFHFVQETTLSLLQLGKSATEHSLMQCFPSADICVTLCRTRTLWLCQFTATRWEGGAARENGKRAIIWNGSQRATTWEEESFQLLHFWKRPLSLWNWVLPHTESEKAWLHLKSAYENRVSNAAESEEGFVSEL